jgi:hypothetical protein
MLAYLSCTTLDIIGIAGFNYSFGALRTLVNKNGNRASTAAALHANVMASGYDQSLEPNGAVAEAEKEDPLSSALSQAIDATTGTFTFLQLLKIFFPIFRWITFDRRTRVINKSRSIISGIGTQIVNDRKRAISEENKSDRAKDLLTLLIKANLSDGEEGKSGLADRSLTDEEVMNQIPTFFLAGHETTSTSTAWTLVSLACSPNIQDKLRAELLEVSTDHPTMEQLNALPYLDMVVREALRYHAVVPSSVRIASQDDIIPFEKPFEDKYGNVMTELRYASFSLVSYSIS